MRPQRGVARIQDASRCGISYVLHKPILLYLTGVSAALVFQQEVQAPSTPLRVAFDGDAVLFSDETDQVFREQGLEGAMQYERAMEAVPIGEVSKAAIVSTSSVRVLPQAAKKKAQILTVSLCVYQSSVPRLPDLVSYQKRKKQTEQAGQMSPCFLCNLRCLGVFAGSHKSLCHAPGEYAQEVQSGGVPHSHLPGDSPQWPGHGHPSHQDTPGMGSGHR